MFLTVGHVVGPVARVQDVVVEQREGTLLDGGGAVPAVPVAGAGGGVREDAVLPLTVVTDDRLLCKRRSDVVNIVTNKSLKSRVTYVLSLAARRDNRLDEDSRSWRRGRAWSQRRPGRWDRLG